MFVDNITEVESASMRDSIEYTTIFIHTSMVVHPRSDDDLSICKFIYKGLLSSLSKKHQHGNISLKNTALGFDYKLSINMLMKQLYIVVRYFFVLTVIELLWKKIIKLFIHHLQIQKVST